MRAFLTLLSGLIVFGTTVPYFIDIAKQKVTPLRSTRLMFLVLILLAFFQQRSLGTGLTLVVTVAELAASSLLFLISMIKGTGGLRKIDIACYLLLSLSVVVWIISKDAGLALLFTILADFVAFFPVIYRTFYDPFSETQLFYWGGVLGPVVALLAVPEKSYKNTIFIIYLAVVNFLVVLLINRQHLLGLKK